MPKEPDFVRDLHEHGFKIKPVKIRKANPEKLRVEVEKYNSELEARAKKREELIIPVECHIFGVRFYGSGNRTFTPSSEIVDGGRNPEYPVGDSYSCEFDVESHSKIKKLSFIGWPA